MALSAANDVEVWNLSRICVTSNLIDVRCKASSSLLKRMAQSEHVQRRRRETIRIAHLVSSRVLLQVILAPESFAADDAGVRPDASVNPLVSRQFLVPGEGLPAGLHVALERSLACNDGNERYIPARKDVCDRDICAMISDLSVQSTSANQLCGNMKQIEKKREANWREGFMFEERYARSISSTLRNERFKMFSVYRRTCMINVDILYTRGFQLTSVYPNVSLELTIVAEGDVAILAAKFLRAHLFHLLGCNILPMHHLHRFLHGTRVESRRKDRWMQSWLDGAYHRVGIERGMKIGKAVIQLGHYRVRNWWGSRDIRVRDRHRASSLASCRQVLRGTWKSVERWEISQRANVVRTVRIRIPRNPRVGRPSWVEDVRPARCILNSTLDSIFEGRRGAGSYVVGGLASSSTHPRASSCVWWCRVRCALVRETVIVFLHHHRDCRDCRGRRCRRGHDALVVVLLLAVRHIVDGYNAGSLVFRHVPRSEKVGLQPRHFQACRWKILNIRCSSWDFAFRMNLRLWQSAQHCSGLSKTYWTRKSI